VLIVSAEFGLGGPFWLLQFLPLIRLYPPHIKSSGSESLAQGLPFGPEVVVGVQLFAFHSLSKKLSVIQYSASIRWSKYSPIHLSASHIHRFTTEAGFFPSADLLRLSFIVLWFLLVPPLGFAICLPFARHHFGIG
jgi:hypothetical protein